ncbi:MAG: hypothetical protein EXS55_02880 [Candidatus Magasanikbacteria bacterium]|nr:hypothetical protein [Candidatus Magasanikbacteria bacterium]
MSEGQEKPPVEGEQSVSRTPLLDAVLERLGPPSLLLELRVQLAPVIEAQARLQKKLAERELTQLDIEKELAVLPNIGGMETDIEGLIKSIRSGLPRNDIRILPVDENYTEYPELY